MHQFNQDKLLGVNSFAPMYIHEFAQSTDDGHVHISIRQDGQLKPTNIQMNIHEVKRLRNNLNRVIEVLTQESKCETCGETIQITTACACGHST